MVDLVIPCELVSDRDKFSFIISAADFATLRLIVMQEMLFL